MAIGCNAFYLYPKGDKILQIFLYLYIMLRIYKADKLHISVNIILITHWEKLLKLSCIHPQTNPAAL